MKIVFRFLQYISFGILFFSGLLALGSRLNIPGGFRIYSVLTGSMEPAISVGSLIITRIPTSLSDIKQNDIITFSEPRFENNFITHRVYNVVENGSVTLFQTKGDANDSPDAWNIAYGSIKGNYVFEIPYLGYLLNFVKTPLGILIFVIVPVLIIAISEIKTILTILFQAKIEKDKRLEKDTIAEHMLTLLAFTLSTMIFAWNSQNARALFRSSPVTIPNSVITTAIVATPTLIPNEEPSGCPDFPDITISGNGAGSHNEVEIDIECEEKTNQTNESNIENTVSVSNNGGNTATTVTINNSSNINVATSSAQH